MVEKRREALHIRMCVIVFVCVCLSVCLSVCVCVCVCVHVCTFVCMRAYVFCFCASSLRKCQKRPAYLAKEAY